MIKLIVAAIILILIMIIFVFILFKNIIKRINTNAKAFFVNKMQSYDYILEEKQKKLEELNQKIQELEISQNNLELENDDLEIEYRNKERLLNRKGESSINYNMNVPKYRESQFFDNYKQVKKVFSINNEQIIRDFIKEHKNTKEEQEYKKLNKIKDMFDENTIYECLTLDIANQKNIVQEVLDEVEVKSIDVDSITNDQNFSVKNFVKLIDEKIEKLDPTIYVYVNGNSNGYEKINKNIVIQQYNNMSEGIIIKFRDKIYDYSI